MEINPSENELDALLGEAEERRQRLRRLRDTVSQYKFYLSERGIAINEEVEFELTMLASAKLMVEAALAEADDPKPLLAVKKQMQAHLILKERAPVFLELVDVEFPGEALQPSDIDTIAKQFSAELDIQERTMKIYGEIEAAMLAELSLGLDDLNERQAWVLDELIFTATTSLAPQDKFDRARSLLMNAGLAEDWSGLLARFFPV